MYMALAAGLANLLLAVWQAGEERKTFEKRAFRGVCPQIFQLLFHFILSKMGLKVEYKFILP